MDKCDAEVFKNGRSLAALDARSGPAEQWVRAVAEHSGQRVDWHYSGGRAHVLVLGDHAKALGVAKAMPKTADVHVLRWFEEEEEGVGLYRAGVTPIADDVIAVDGGTVFREKKP